MRYNKKYYRKTTKKKFRFKKPLFIALCVLLAGAAIVTALELTDTTTWFHEKNLVTAPVEPDRTAGSETKGEQPATPAHDNPNKSETGTPGPATEVKAPAGIFVSNHHPNLSGRPNPNEIQSVCETTPGALCEISFTKGSETRSLPGQQTDGEGAAYWTWKLQDIGLTAGSWKVQAKATLGSQIKTTDDAMTLEVQP